MYNENPCDSTIYILLFLPSWMTSWIFYNAETQQHHASQIRRMPLLLKTTRKKVIDCDSDFKSDFALKWRPSWTPSLIIQPSESNMFHYNHLYHLDSKKPYKVNTKMLFIAFFGQIGLRGLNDVGHLGRHL